MIVLRKESNSSKREDERRYKEVSLEAMTKVLEDCMVLDDFSVVSGGSGITLAGGGGHRDLFKISRLKKTGDELLIVFDNVIGYIKLNGFVKISVRETNRDLFFLVSSHSTTWNFTIQSVEPQVIDELFKS